METPVVAPGLTPTSSQGDWFKVLIVTAGSFIMVTSEFLPVGLLTRIATDIHKSPGQLGLMVTAPGLTAAIAAPCSLLVLHRWDRRHILIGLTILIALADLVVATVSNFGLILFGRVLLGAAVGGFWSYSPDAARRLVGPDKGNLAVAIILGGIAIGTIVGVPIGAYLGEMIGWRVTFGSAVVFAFIIAGCQVVALPSLPSTTGSGKLAFAPLLQIPNLKMGFLAITLVVLGHFACYTYLEAFVVRAAHPTTPQLSWVLGTYGLAGFVGTFAGERLTRLSKRFAFPIAAAVMTASLLWCLTMPHPWMAVVPPVIFWGAAYGAVPVCSRIWLFNAAPKQSEIVSAFYVSAFQFALAAGAFTGGVVIDNAGIPATLGYGAFAAALGGVIMLIISLRPETYAGDRQSA